MKLDVVKMNILLASHGLTKTELARRAGMSRQNISTIVKRGTCEPKTAGKLAVGFGVSVEDLMEDAHV